jgi:hypothetical protein
LSLATKLNQAGYATLLIHGKHFEAEPFIASLISKGLLPTRYPIFLSIPSFYALEWAQDFCRLVKQTQPTVKIIVGGRWVANPDPQWLHGKLPEADHIFIGLGEAEILKLMSLPKNAYMVLSSLTTEISGLSFDYKLIDEFEEFQPSIEVSRGCGMKCAFCEERDIPLSKTLAANLLADQFDYAIEQYGTSDIRPYLESSFFIANPSWSEKLAQEVKRRNTQIKWRCETRVDAITRDSIASLSEAGLKVIDLGLESASPTQLLRMKKTRKPDKYLDDASAVLKACHDYGVWPKVNILLYAGESAETVNETKEWLKTHSKMIKGVSVGPVVVYGPPSQAAPLIKELEEFGARAVNSTDAQEDAISAIHLSKEIDADGAENLSLELSRMMMSKEDYYDLKSFSYYPRSYRLANFEQDVEASDKSQLPFSFA